jgi:hypothetical protein
MLKALETDSDRTPKEVLKFWQERKMLEAEPQNLPSEAVYYARLDDEKMEALNDAYYRELKGALGVRAFWEWFKRNNEKQKESIENKGKPTGRQTNTFTRKDGSTGTYEYKVRPWIKWREVRAFVAAQESIVFWIKILVTEDANQLAVREVRSARSWLAPSSQPANTELTICYPQ